MTGIDVSTDKVFVSYYYGRFLINRVLESHNLHSILFLPVKYQIDGTPIRKTMGLTKTRRKGEEKTDSGQIVQQTLIVRNNP